MMVFIVMLPLPFGNQKNNQKKNSNFNYETKLLELLNLLKYLW